MLKILVGQVDCLFLRATLILLGEWLQGVGGGSYMAYIWEIAALPR